MAQVLRPLPKRRPSQITNQITSQASAASSQPSSRAPSYPNSVQLPNIKECAALAEQPAVPALIVPKADDSTPAAGAATDVCASTPKTQERADLVADAGATTLKTQASTEQGAADPAASTLKPAASTGQDASAGASAAKVDASADRVTPDTAAVGASDIGQQNAEKASSHTSTEQPATQEGAGKPSRGKPQKDEYVSPFEQAQEPAAASTQGLSPFANIS